MVALITAFIPIINFIIDRCSRSQAIAEATKRHFIRAVVEGLNQSAKSVALKDSWDAQGKSFAEEIKASRTPEEQQRLDDYIKAAEEKAKEQKRADLTPPIPGPPAQNKT